MLYYRENKKLKELLKKAEEVLAKESKRSMLRGANRDTVERNDDLRDAIRKALNQ